MGRRRPDDLRLRVRNGKTTAARRWVIAAHVGHSRKSLTLDTYAHVLIED